MQCRLPCAMSLSVSQTASHFAAGRCCGNAKRLASCYIASSTISMFHSPPKGQIMNTIIIIIRPAILDQSSLSGHGIGCCCCGYCCQAMAARNAGRLQCLPSEAPLIYRERSIATATGAAFRSSDSSHPHLSLSLHRHIQ